MFINCLIESKNDKIKKNLKNHQLCIEVQPYIDHYREKVGYAEAFE